MSPARKRWYRIVFKADTPAGMAFDVTLLVAILLSVAVVMLESVTSVRERYGDELLVAEWVFTGLFTLEYLLRVWCARDRRGYVRSFYGIIDLLAILPMYLSLVGLGTTYGVVVRTLRLLRVFRVFNLGQFMGDANALGRAVVAAQGKIVVFLLVVLTIVVILGAAMYLVEAGENGFTSIPQSMYWAIVTMTTVGYGDIAPQTVPGKFIAAAMMILGYSLIIVPTGIISVEAVRIRPTPTAVCSGCAATDHDDDALHCKHCGTALSAADRDPAALP